MKLLDATLYHDAGATVSGVSQRNSLRWGFGRQDGSVGSVDYFDARLWHSTIPEDSIIGILGNALLREMGTWIMICWTHCPLAEVRITSSIPTRGKF
jgi:hypothetical protein